MPPTARRRIRVSPERATAISPTACAIRHIPNDALRAARVPA
jgi:hypothetical protein